MITTARRPRRVSYAALGGVLALVASAPVAAAAATTATTAWRPPTTFRQVNLISDVPGLARLTDPSVVNPWGIALGPTTPLWVANNGTATATIYAGANGSSPLSKVPLTVSLPPQPTGQVFNPTEAFRERRGGTQGTARFLFDTIPGRVAVWSPDVPPLTRALSTAAVAHHVYLGLALARTSAGPRLFAADGAGRIDVFDGRYRLISTPGTFTDRWLPKGLAPYNVAALDGKVYVAYAPAPGAAASVDGAIDVYAENGRLLKRLVTGGPLDDPWGMVIAPASWSHFGGMLLVGNEENGRINAFDPATGHFAGALRDLHGTAIANPGLWGLAFGNGTFASPRDLIFAAGIDEYQHGLVGVIRPD